ncbi:RsmD family RNA methyltransferase [Parasaccharibacter sp. TMW2.1882]|uniref:RsmD family RNA methyltransferase n=2 Tax=Acetobacteraceae TaxID=433 RepID=A0ABX4ZPB1_9PROT|nr:MULTISPECIES: RsmD family RNA methyltransferase [Acetobacteraceae]MCK8636160.1 RsmD family RNA methyltransferase [Parasaccharibacter sp. TMW2.1885]MCL1496799.1 RsmD family RNA methyltransferase [Parasaccharibacter sp. TMW2.1882]MCT6819672.1 RsmD family RNA methyltransferase [Bombella apis]MCT6846259.1 RsmD family RNA methyltransferase [Bombella apis]POS61382.1 RsmD family RNA methyltransferase [Parasaccharibacter apium]
MRIIAGTARNRRLQVPAGMTTRPTAQRARQTLFDMLMHAPWFGRDELEKALVLDAFAGTGALGLEALSRGARFATFMEGSRPGIAALQANLRSCGMADRARLRHCDVTHPPKAPQPHTLIFLDPPYHKGLVQKGLRTLWRAGWVADGALIVAETETTPLQNDGRDPEEPFQPFHAHLLPSLAAPPPELLAQRSFGAATLHVWRHDGSVKGSRPVP